MSWQLGILLAVMRAVARRHLGRVPTVAAARRSFDRVARVLFQMPPGMVVLPDRFGEGVGGRGGVPALWVRAARPRLGTNGPAAGGSRGAILYLHGGGYVLGSAATHAGLAGALAQRTGLPVALPDYRLAPERPFPAQLEDALTAWDALIARGYRPEQMVLAGDSAGGGLAAALLGHLCAQGRQGPGRIVLFSPWTDLTLGGDSLRVNARRDPLLEAGRIEELRQMVLQGADPCDPRASPLLADFHGAGPVLIQVGTDEILRSDAERLAQRMRVHGVEATCDIWPKVPHVWQIFHGFLPEADRALERVAAFITGGASPR